MFLIQICDQVMVFSSVLKEQRSVVIKYQNTIRFASTVYQKEIKNA